MKAIQPQSSTPVFSFVIILIMVVLTLALLPLANQLWEQINLYLADLLNAGRFELSRLYGV